MKIIATKSVKGLWDTYTYPLVPGTPINKDGEVSDDTDAIGIVMETIYQKPDNIKDQLAILTGGFVEASEIAYELGESAKAAIKGVTFFKADGSVEGSAVATFTAALEDGDMVSSTTYAEALAAVKAGQFATFTIITDVDEDHKQGYVMHVCGYTEFEMTEADDYYPCVYFSNGDQWLCLNSDDTITDEPKANPDYTG